MIIFLILCFLFKLEELEGSKVQGNSSGTPHSYLSEFDLPIGLKRRVVGGKPVDITAFPHLVQFFNRNNLCAGNILNKNIILTAAHCFDFGKNVQKMSILAGARYILDEQAVTYDVLDYLLHEEYNKTRLFSCDIALLLIGDAIKYSDKVAPARLVNHDRWMKPTERQFYIAGWGWTKYGGQLTEKGLLYTYLKFIPLELCQKLHGTKLTPDMFCLYGNGIRDACKGDSGGAISWRGMLVGIVSHGDGCAFTNKPSIYANIYYFRKWIDEAITKLNEIYCKKNI